MDNENVALYKETFFDKIFKPEIITLANGHSVRRRRSRTPLIVAALILVIFWALKMTEFDFMVIIERFTKMLDLLKKIFQPDWTFFPKVISPLLDTIKMSILGSVLGALAYVALYMLKTFIAGQFIDGLTYDAVTAKMLTKLPGSMMNAVFAFIVAPILLGAIKPALKKAGLYEKL